MSREVRFCVSSVGQIIIGEILGMVFVEGKTLGNPPPKLVPPKHQLCQQGLSEPCSMLLQNQPQSLHFQSYCNRWVGKIIGVYGPTVRVEGMHIIESWSVNDTAKPSLNP